MRFLPSIFSIALFTSAFLSFSVQPILGKMLLPMVGGAPASWIVAMSFFQLALLAGYGLSYLMGRFSPWVHAVGLIILYALGFCFLPPVMPVLSGEAQGFELSIDVFVALFKTIFVPFLALTATTAALQRVFSATNDPTAKDPYYLFIASNIGSFTGLFVYPFLLEPTTGLAWQSHAWKLIYVLAIAFIFFACVVAWANKAKTVVVKKAKVSKTTISQKQILTWIILSFIPCSLSMGVTTLITTDIGGLPLFWVIPLGLYLLTFVFAFSPKEFLKKKNADFYHVIAAMFMVLFLSLEIGYQPSGEFWLFGMLSVLLLGIFFFSAWACHQKLADSRPDPQHLTLYYFVIALGGAIAGILHAFVYPFVLPWLIEFPATILLSLLVTKKYLFNIEKWPIQKLDKIFKVLLVVGCLALMIGFTLRINHMPRYIYSIFSFVFMFVVLLIVTKPRYLMVLGFLALFTSVHGHYPGHLLETGRNFFGVRAVYDRESQGRMVRYFGHGNTVHGVEIVDDKKTTHDMNYGYYLHGGPIEDAINISHAKTVGILGLGAGQLACFDSKLTIDFYEIDQAVEDTARTYFTYLKRCPVRQVFIGDGRLMIKKENRKYDMIILDAFSSDGIPLHLITKEAIDVYKNQLNENGLLLFHISNRYLNLSAPLAAEGQVEGLVSYKKSYIKKKENKDQLQLDSIWFAMSLDKNSSKKFEKMGWKKEEHPQNYVWTDDHSSILSAFAWFGSLPDDPKAKKTK